MSGPPLVTGYLKKQGHVVRNWKRRFFVLEQGRLTYFEKTSGKEQPPYGINPKGCLVVGGMELQEPEEPTEEDRTKIYLIDVNTGKDLLVSAASESEASMWKEALYKHISFAQYNPSLVLQPGDDLNDDESRRVAAIGVNGETLPIRSISKLWNAEEIVAQRPSVTPISSAGVEGDFSRSNTTTSISSGGYPGKLTVTPEPGFVLKTRRDGGMKVFINVCECSEVPSNGTKRGHKRWPVMVLGSTFRRTVDKNAEECAVIDVCVNSTTMQDCIADKSAETKEEVGIKIIDALVSRDKEKASGGNGEVGSLDKTFTMPKLSKRYKGDVVVEMHLPISIREEKKSVQIYEALSEAEANGDVGDNSNGNRPSSVPIGGSVDASGGRKGSMFSLSRGNKGKFKSAVTAAMQAKAQSVDITAPVAPKRYIAFRVERQVGSVVKQRPEKSAPRVKTLLQGAKVLVYGRRSMPDGSTWYRLAEGWTIAYSEGGQRMLRPVSDSQPLACKVKGAKFVEVEGEGWFASKEHKAVLSLEFTYPRDSVLRVNRTVSEVRYLNKDLKSWAAGASDSMTRGRLEDKLNEKQCPANKSTDGLPLMDDIDTLLDLTDQVETWLTHIVMSFDAQECPPLQGFLTPTDTDCQAMETDLMAPAGLDGAWGIYE